MLYVRKCSSSLSYLSTKHVSLPSTYMWGPSRFFVTEWAVFSVLPRLCWQECCLNFGRALHGKESSFCNELWCFWLSYQYATAASNAVSMLSILGMSCRKFWRRNFTAFPRRGELLRFVFNLFSASSLGGHTRRGKDIYDDCWYYAVANAVLWQRIWL